MSMIENLFHNQFMNTMLRPQNPLAQFLSRAGMQEPQGNAPSMVPPQQNPSPSPLQAGAQAGMNSAKNSIALDEDQKRKSLGMAIGAFFHNKSMSGKAGLEAATQAMYPAMQAYQAQQAAFAEQNALAQKMAMLEQEKQQRSALEREKFEESKRATRELEAYRNNTLAVRPSSKNKNISTVESVEVPGLGQIDLSNYSPIETASQKNQLFKAKKGASHVISGLKHLEDEVNEFEKMTEKDFIRADNPVYGNARNIVTDFAGTHGLSSHFEKERIKRKKIEDLEGQLRVTIERDLKGTAPGEAMMKRFEKYGLLPRLKDGIPLMREKINTLKKMTQNIKIASDLSLRSGRIIDEGDIDNIISNSSPQQELSTEQNIPDVVKALKQQHPDYSYEEIMEVAKEEGLL